jgi:superfamily II helicase
MVVKRVSPGKKQPRRKASATPKSELTDSAVMVVLESEQSVSSIDPDIRRQLVAAEAYFLAERRGFVGGNEIEDWVSAERVVDLRLQQKQVA